MKASLFFLLVVLVLALMGCSTPTVAPTHTPPAVKTAVPMQTPSPSPPPLVELADEPLKPTLTISDPGPSVADLAIQVIPAETSVYTLTVRNHGPDPATSIVFTATLPNGVTPLWAESAQPGCGRQGCDIGCDLGDLQVGDAVTVTLNLTASGSESLITGTQLAGATLTLPRPTCAIDRDSSPSQVTCHLSRLQPGAEAQVRIGTRVDDPATRTLVHTATVAAHETDPDHSNNHTTSTVTAVLTATDLVLQADGPSTVIADQPFTYTYTIVNRGALDATGVWFTDTVPSDMNLVAYVPGAPECEQQGDTFTCTLRDPDNDETVTFTLVITGHGGQPMQMGLDPLMPSWPVCSVLKERTWLHIVLCELGMLKPGQATRVQLVFVAIGEQERTSVNTASVLTDQVDSNPVDNTSTVTITIQAGAEPDQP